MTAFSPSDTSVLPSGAGILRRRGFLSGFASIALGAMLHRDGVARDGDWAPPDGRPHFPPKAKRVIWLFMNGGVSHMESFDPKPMLTKYGGKTIAETPFAETQAPGRLAIERVTVPDANGNQRNTLYPLQVGFRKHGQSGIELLEQLNAIRAAESPHDAALAARVASYELAFRMQRSVPEAVDFSQETAETQSLYGLDVPDCRSFGMQMLAARRLVERGVRFIQVQHGAGGAGAWDAHGGLKANHARNALAVDQPIGALLEDLARRGLLDETLVIFATEFGRTPGSQGADGRDHHIFGFSVWMAGGGIKGGVVHGATDEIGFHAVEDRHYVTDIHATILKQLGLDSRRLEIPGRKRLEIDHGTPIKEIIA
jgi:hypothetical protein